MQIATSPSSATAMNSIGSKHSPEAVKKKKASRTNENFPSSVIGVGIFSDRLAEEINFPDTRFRQPLER